MKVQNFAEAPSINIPRSTLRMPFKHITTIDVDYLIPLFRFHAIPGDTIKVEPHIFGRLNTPLYPILDNLYGDIQFFSIPYRILWDNFRKFMGEQINPGDSIDYTVPQIAATATTGYSNMSLPDYLGIPTQVPDFKYNAWDIRAYQECYNHWYRDQNLIDSVTVSKADGPDTTTSLSLQKRGKRHDYITSALPWLQKPDATYANGVTLPLGTTAPVTGIGKVNQTYAAGPVSVYETDGIASVSYANYHSFNGTSGDNTWYGEEDPDNSGYPNIRADLSNAAAATVNQLRQAFQIQKLLERDARSGTRYPEIIASHFGGVRFNDASYRPEFLSSGSSRVEINTVPQTSEAGTTPQGNLAGYGTIQLHSGGFTKTFTEHCVVLGIFSIRADLTYQQGLHRDFTKQTRYDYFWPELQHIGEQAIDMIELYCQDPATDTGSTGTPDNERVFGYQERYAEYKYKPNMVTGKMRSNDAASLDAWGLWQEFSGLPALDQTFIESTTPMDRVVAVTSEPDFLIDSTFDIVAARPMSIYSTPGMIDHF